MLKIKLFCLMIIVIVSSPCLFAQVENVSTIGGIIDTKNAKEWTERYKSEIGGVEGHLYGRNLFKEIFEPSYVEGVYIFKGLDDHGLEHLIFLRADKEGNITDPSNPQNNGRTCPPSCIKAPVDIDIASLGGDISKELADKMINNYQTKYPDKMKAQLYGKELFKSLLGSEEVAGVYILNALDNNNQERFVLVGTDKSGVLDWTEPGDTGKTCPPYCPVVAYISENYK